MIADDKTMAYVAVKKDCGCTVACTMDTPDNQRYLPDDLKSFAKEGYHIEHVLLSVAYGRLKSCICADVERLTKKDVASVC